jgi:ABC-type polysaccharide/polyol phosphate export permease
MAYVAVPQAGARQWAWLLGSFTRREILNRYAGSVTGLAWSLLHPLAQLAIFAFVFSQIFRVAVPPAFTGVSYAAYVAIAMWPWIMFSEGLTRGMASVHANAGLIKKVAFPHGLLVYSSVLACYVVHLVGFAAVLIALRLFGEPIRFSGIPAALVLLVPYMLLATGIGAFLAALHTLLRDVEHVVQVLLTIVFYVSPILYPASIIPASMQALARYNPLAYFSERLREIVLHGAGLVATDAVVALACIAVFAAGMWFFNRLSPSFEDFL